MGKGNIKFSSYFNLLDPKNKRTERNNQKPTICFRYGLGDHWISDILKPEVLEKRVHCNM